MNILLLNDDYPTMGGRSSVGSIVAGLAEQYRRQGHTVTVITSHRRAQSAEIIRTSGVISLPVSYRPSLRQYHCLWSPSVSRMLRQEIAALQPDIVHAHNVHLYLTYNALRIAKKSGARVFITLHDVMSFAYWRITTQQYLSPARDAHLSLSDHWRSSGLEFNPLRNRWIRRIFARHTDQIFAVSQALKDAAVQHGIGKISVVHNGIDPAQWHSADAHALATFRKKHDIEGKRIIFFGGRLSTDKGSTPVLQSINALRQEFPDIMLLVAGDKRVWPEMLKAAKVDEKILSRFCRLAGWLDTDDMRIAYSVSSIVTTPSLCLDCFPSTNLEAMAAGKPVVGTVFGGTPEAVEHGVTGFVCDPRTPEYTEYLRRLLSDNDLARRMGEAGRTRITQDFSLEKQAKTYMELYTRTQE